MRKNWIYLKRGILTPEHVRKMGVRVWLFAYMVDIADWETGIVDGWKDKDAADELGMPRATVRDQRTGLESAGYIVSRQVQHGMSIEIAKWVNPRGHFEQEARERSTELASMSYAEYLKSAEWQRIRIKALKRSGFACQVCDERNTVLDVHHRRYPERGRERDGDLIVLCRKCHELFSREGRLASKDP